MQLLAGTYTQGTDSKGIYRLEFDPSDGTLSTPTLAVTTANPTWLIQQRDRLLAANEHADRDNSGEITVFAAGEDTLTELQRLPSYGADPCHLAISDSRLAVANYSGGTVGLFAWEGTATGNLIRVIRPTRTGEHIRQQAPHPHGVYFRDGELWVPDLGGDCVYVYDGATGESLRQIDAPPGSGPRHLTSDGHFLVNELANTVLPIKGGFSGSPVSTLPDHHEAPSATAEIQQLRDKLYVSNRGHDSIVVFETQPTLKAVQHRDTEGAHPRHFLIAPGGQYLLVANRDSNNIISISMTPEGLLDEKVSEIACPSPMHLLLLDRD